MTWQFFSKSHQIEQPVKPEMADRAGREQMTARRTGPASACPSPAQNCHPPTDSILLKNSCTNACGKKSSLTVASNGSCAAEKRAHRAPKKIDRHGRLLRPWHRRYRRALRRKEFFFAMGSFPSARSSPPPAEGGAFVSCVRSMKPVCAKPSGLKILSWQKRSSVLPVTTSTASPKTIKPRSL